MTDNPFMKLGSWFWFDEVYDEYGPYGSKEEAQQGLSLYCVYLEGKGMAGLQRDVAQFHLKFGLPIGYNPGSNFDSVEQRQLRASLVLEEALELVAAMGLDPRQAVESYLNSRQKECKASLPEAMDAVADLVYVALGTAVTFGVIMWPIWNEVQKTNMAKVGGASRADGKLLKPPGWQPPDIRAILLAQGWKPEVQPLEQGPELAPTVK